MGGLGINLRQRIPQPRDDGHEQHVEIKFSLGCDGEAAVEPAEIGFSCGVDVVIEIHQAAAEAAALLQEFNQRVKARARLGALPQHGDAGKLLTQEPRKLVCFGSG